MAGGAASGLAGVAAAGAVEQVGDEQKGAALLVGKAFAFGGELAEQGGVTGGEGSLDRALAGLVGGVGHGSIVTEAGSCSPVHLEQPGCIPLTGTAIVLETSLRPGNSRLPMTPVDKVFSSWKEIAAYLGKGVRTVQRWEAVLGLPVHHRRNKGSCWPTSRNCSSGPTGPVSG